MATPATVSTPTPAKTFKPYIAATESPAEFTLKAVDHRRAVRAAVRRVDGLPGPARRPDGQRVDSDRRPGDLGAQEARRLDDSRKQHRPDHRVGRRVGGRRRGVHDSGAHLPDAVRPGVFQLLPDLDAGLCRRHPGRADDGAAAPRADRQGARRAALSRGHGLRGRARRRRARRRAGGHGVRRPGRRRLWKSLSWIFNCS